MKRGPMISPISQRGHQRRAGAEGLVADEVEQPLEIHATRRADTASGSQPSRSAKCATTLPSPTEFEPFTSTASPAREAELLERGDRFAGSVAMGEAQRRAASAAAARFPQFAREGEHLVARPGSHSRHALRPAGSASCACIAGAKSPSSFMLPSTAIAAGGGGLAELRERGAHAGGIGVVAFVDQQRVAARHRNPVPRAAALEPAHFGQREARPRRGRRPRPAPPP